MHKPEQQHWQRLPDDTCIGAIALRAKGGVGLLAESRVATCNELYDCVGELVYALSEPMPHLLATLHGVATEVLETRSLRRKSALHADRLLVVDNARELLILRYCRQEFGWSCFRALLDRRARALLAFLEAAAQADHTSSASDDGTPKTE